jgi:hypothetical protein
LKPNVINYYVLECGMVLRLRLETISSVLYCRSVSGSLVQIEQCISKTSLGDN